MNLIVMGIGWLANMQESSRKGRLNHRSTTPPIFTGDLTGEARRITDLFNKYPETRDNYAALVLRYYGEYYGYIDESLKELKTLAYKQIIALPSPELITRISRKLQNDLGMFRPTQDTQRKRNEGIEAYINLGVTK